MEWSYLPVPATSLSATKKEHILLPKLRSNDDKGSSFDKSLAAAIKAHEKFLQEVQHLSSPEVEEQATRDIKGVLYVFPIVQPYPEAIIAMSAWFRLLVAVDDAIEQLAVSDARLVLERCIEMCRPPGGSKRADSPMSEPADTEVAAQCSRIAGWMQVFKTHVGAVVPDTVLEDVLLDISRIWRAMLREESVMNAPAFDETAYFEVRRETTGLQPFFRLVEHSLGVPSSNRMASLGLDTSRRIGEMKRLVKMIVGLQNDLFGLKKDVQEGEGFNRILLARRDSSAQETDTCVIETIEIHNQLVKEAVATWKKLVSDCEGIAREGCGPVGKLADALLRCIKQHAEWAAADHRYKTEGL